MGFVVEFCGLPGAGKSTLARTLVARLRLQGIPTTEVMAPLGPDAQRASRIVRKVGAVARGLGDPGSARLIVEVGLRTGQADRRDRVARPANLVVVRHAVRRARAALGVHVLDQGPLQEWWSAALRADGDRVLALAAADRADRADLIIRVDTPIDVLLERLGARAARQSRLEAVETAERRAELERGSVLLDALCSQLVHSPGTHRPVVKRVDGLDPAVPDLILEMVDRTR